MTSRSGLASGAWLGVLALAPMVLASAAWAGDAHAPACTRVVISADPAYPPLHWYDGHDFQGASIQIARHVLDDLGIAYEFRPVGPFARLMIAARNGEVDMIATLKITPEREQFLLFTRVAALSNPAAVFVERGHRFAYRGREDLVGLRGGVTRGNKFGQGFDEYLQSRLTVEEANTAEANFRKLASGRIDYLVTGYYTGMAELVRMGDESRFEALHPFVANTENFLALTRKGRCTGLLPALNARLAALRKDGTLDRLMRENIETWKRHPQIAD